MMSKTFVTRKKLRRFSLRVEVKSIHPKITAPANPVRAPSRVWVGLDVWVGVIVAEPWNGLAKLPLVPIWIGAFCSEVLPT